MSIPQPTLDDRSYADLLDEARALIPSLAPQWTNHNPSDPGITLVELFAWLTEMLIYRVNRLPAENTRAFLRLLNGPQWTPGPDLTEDIRATVLDLRKRHRAVTTEDYEELAKAVPGVARARCVPRRNLEALVETERRKPREGYVSLVVVPDPEQPGAKDPDSLAGAPLPSSSLLTDVRSELAPRRLLTVRQLIVPPIYVPIQAEVVAASRPDVPDATQLRNSIGKALRDYLDPLHGGPEGDGWPFGRDVYVSELYRLLEKVPGVDYVTAITLSSTLPAGGAPRSVPGDELWHEAGDQIGIALTAHHLPWAQVDPARIVLGSAFLPVRVQVEATAAAGVAPAAARRAVKTRVRSLFNPPPLNNQGPGGASPKGITTDDVASELESLDEITAASVTIAADPGRLFDDEGATGVRFAAGEMADVTITVNV